MSTKSINDHIAGQDGLRVEFRYGGLWPLTRGTRWEWLGRLCSHGMTLFVARGMRGYEFRDWAYTSVAYTPDEVRQRAGLTVTEFIAHIDRTVTGVH